MGFSAAFSSAACVAQGNVEVYGLGFRLVG